MQTGRSGKMIGVDRARTRKMIGPAAPQALLQKSRYPRRAPFATITLSPLGRAVTMQGFLEAHHHAGIVGGAPPRREFLGRGATMQNLWAGVPPCRRGAGADRPRQVAHAQDDRRRQGAHAQDGRARHGPERTRPPAARCRRRPAAPPESSGWAPPCVGSGHRAESSRGGAPPCRNFCKCRRGHAGMSGGAPPRRNCGRGCHAEGAQAPIGPDKARTCKMIGPRQGARARCPAMARAHAPSPPSRPLPPPPAAPLSPPRPFRKTRAFPVGKGHRNAGIP